VCREGNLEQAASFTSAAWEDRGMSTALHAREVLSEHYAPLVYHGGHKLAGTTQLSATRAFVFAGYCAALTLTSAYHGAISSIVLTHRWLCRLECNLRCS